MRKLFTFKTILLACAMLVGNSVWAGVKSLFLQNFENNSTGAWVCPNNAESMQIANLNVPSAILGSYHFIYGPLTSSRGMYEYFVDENPSYSLTGYNEYAIDFDFNFNKATGTSDATYVYVVADGIAGTGNINWGYDSYYDGTTDYYLFGFQIPNNSTTITINKDKTVTIEENTWYHFNVQVNCNDATATYKITKSDSPNGDPVAEGTKSDLVSTQCKGMYMLAARNNSILRLDNISVTTEVDEEVVDAPIINTPIYNGESRIVTIADGKSSENNDVKTYYTLDGEDPTASSNEYTSDLIIDKDCTIKAISISSTGVSSNVASLNVTVGKLQLNAPVINITDYADGKYTISITSDQSSLAFVPASTDIKYSIDNGAEETYSAGISIPEGSTIKVYVTADKYIDSETVEKETGIQPNLPVSFSQNYVGVVTADKTLSYDGEKYYECVQSNVGEDYYTYSADGVTATTNANIGFYLNNQASNPRKWMLRPAGMLNYTAGTVAFGIANVKAGQIIKIERTTSTYGDISVNSGITQLDNISYGTTGYYSVNADGIVYFNAARNVIIENIVVYDINVPVTISPAGYSTFSSEYAVSIPEELTAYIATSTDVNEKYEGTITLQEVTGTVAANTGLLLKGDADQEYNLPVSAEEDESYDNDNLLKPTAANGQVAAGNYIFAFETNDPSKYGFYYLESATGVGAGKAYLKTEGTSEIKTFSFVFDGGTATAIEAVEAADADAEGAIYNVAGQQVGKDYKGIVIKNGKKYLNK